MAGVSQDRFHCILILNINHILFCEMYGLNHIQNCLELVESISRMIYIIKGPFLVAGLVAGLVAT